MVFHDQETVKAINAKGATGFRRSFKKNPRSFLGVLKTYGTYGLLMLNQDIGNLPVNNFKQGWIDDPAFDAAIAHTKIGATIVGKRNPCKWCYLGCKKTSAADTTHTALAEYESMAMLGPNLGLTDLAQIMEANEMCNRLGLDTISTGAIISYLMDVFENGDLDEKQVGFSIRFGESAMVNAATGFNYTFDNLMRVGEDAIQLQRKLYLALGGRDDDLPPFMEQEISVGPTKGNNVSREDFVRAREHYYTLWGWDAAGNPPPD